MDFKSNQPLIIGSILGVVCLAVLVFGGRTAHTPLIQQHCPVPNQSADRTLLEEGTPAPEFRLLSIQGEEIGLKDLGTPTVLVFVWPTCPYCKDLKERLIDQKAIDFGKHLVFITSGKQTLENLSPEVQELERQIRTLYPVLRDSTGSTFATYKASGVPTTYLIDKEGKIRDFAVGPSGGLELVQQLKEEIIAGG